MRQYLPQVIDGKIYIPPKPKAPLSIARKRKITQALAYVKNKINEKKTY